MIWYYLFMGGTLFLLGLVIHRFKAYFLISGYNMYSKEKQEKVDIKAIGKLFGLFGYSNGIVFLGSALLVGLGIPVPIWPSMAFLTITIVLLVVLSQKYDNSEKDDQGSLTKKGKNEKRITLFTIGITAVFVAGVFWFSFSPPKIIINEAGVEIKGMYGGVYPWEEITSIELKDDLPSITLRNNGSSLAGKHKGHFKTKELGQVKLFVDEKVTSYIYLTHEGKVTIINLSTKEKTIDLFEEMDRLK